MCSAYVWPRLVQGQGKKLTLLLLLHMGYSSLSVIALVYEFTLLYKKICFHPVTYRGRHDSFRFWKHPSSLLLGNDVLRLLKHFCCFHGTYSNATTDFSNIQRLAVCFDIFLYPHHKMWGGYTGFAVSRRSVGPSVRPFVRPSVRLQFVSAL